MTTEVMFPIGRAYATPSALKAMKDSATSPATLLDRHGSGDWGDLDEEDKLTNDAAVEHGGRILSAYKLPTGAKVWIITEWTRETTTIMLPEEY